MAGLGWADVADDLLLLLAEKAASVTTLIRFSAVCKLWYSHASATRCCNPVPWLMLAEKEGSIFRDFYDHSTGEVYQFPLPEAQGTKNIGYAHGWLITAGEGGNFHLLNPLSGTQIPLPSITAFPHVRLRDFVLNPRGMRDLFMVKATCSPVGPNSDYIVVATHMGYEHLLLSFCRSADEKWTSVQTHGAKGVSFVYGVFFMVTGSASIYIINFSPAPNLVEIAHLPEEDDLRMERQCYVVGCDGDILVVEKRYNFCSSKMIYAKSFKVFKLDVEGKQVAEIQGIGNYALFLGMNNYICLPIPWSMKTFEKNCIYFTDDRNEQSFCGELESGEDMGVYDLEDGSLTIYCPGGVTKSVNSIPTWVIAPNSLFEASQIRLATVR